MNIRTKATKKLRQEHKNKFYLFLDLSCYIGVFAGSGAFRFNLKSRQVLNTASHEAAERLYTH